MRKTLTLILLFFVLIQTFGQKGKPFIQNFTPYEYSGEDQIWSINQNKNGVLYFGSGDGLLKYDGVKWEKFLINEDKIPVLSSVFGEDNFLYVGSVGEFGYFDTNNSGEIKYNSFINLLDSTDRLFADVWSVGRSNKNIYFATDNAIFRFNSSLKPKIKKIQSELNPFLLYNPNNEVFISFRKEGLYKIRGDSLIKVKTSKPLTPWFMLPYEKDTYLIGNKSDNLQLLYFNDDDSLARFIDKPFEKNEILKTNSFLSENQLYTGACVLSKNLFAIGTIRSGVVVINKKGEIVDIIDKNDNLLSSTVHILFVDKQGGLWSGLSYGISKIEYNSPFRIFDEKDGIPGTIYNLTRFKNKTYVSSNLGLFYNEKGHFVGIDAFTGENSVQVFMPLVFPKKDSKDSLFFVTTIGGIYSITGMDAKKINTLSPNTLFQSEINKSVFYCGLDYELASFYFDGKSFTEPKIINDFSGIISAGVEIDANNIWLIIDGKPIIFNLRNKTITDFNNCINIENVTFTGISKQNKQIIFLTNKGIFRFSKNKFYKDNTLLSDKFSSKSIMQYQFVSKNLSWALIGNNLQSSILKCSKEQNNINFDSTPFKRLLSPHTISEDGDSLFWVISSKTIYKFMINNNKDFSPKSLPVISKITIGKDSVIFNGSYLKQGKPLLEIKHKFNYTFNNIVFEYAFPEFDNEIANEFKYLLRGNSVKKESAWTRETHKEFSNLYEGHYVFMLKARNVYQKETEYIRFEFVISPPWYRTWWAYLLYVVLMGLFIYFMIKLNTRRLEKENIRLDNIVKERTAEIYLQKEEIQTQADNLEEINNQLKETNNKISLIAKNLSEANKKIQDKNIQITDSINYAKKIQKAILPSNSEISEILNEFFIIYKPKDIVGGDFYFLKKFKEYIIIAAADCTGHGVPGGFLSMMGVSFLNEIVQKENTQNPSQALNTLRQKFKNSLRQKDYFSSSTDGIDIALCAINTKSGILEYAGANSPILIIRNNEVIELVPDLQPIGIFFKEKDFTLKSFQLKYDDVIYMFSDGFQDQFGGDNDKKLLFKNLIKKRNIKLF